MKISEVVKLKEGGYALKNTGVTRIKREDIPATVQHVSQVSGIPIEDLHPLGSVGKTPDSGDIDLAVDSSKYDGQKIHDHLIKQLGEENGTYNKGTKVASYAFPIANDQSKGLVQVDLMFTANTDWAKFSYHSPGTESKYKGAIRNILLMGVASSYAEEGTDYFEYDPTTGDLMIRAGRTMDMNVGLRRIFQHRPKKKRGEGYLKSMKTITPQEFKELFPDVEIHGNDIVIDDPDKVLMMLFGKKVKPSQVSTAEQIIDLIKDTFSEDRTEEIFSKTAQRLYSIKDKMDIPPELAEYME